MQANYNLNTFILLILKVERPTLLAVFKGSGIINFGNESLYGICPNI